VRRAIGKHRHFAKEARGELLCQGLGGQKFGQAHARQLEKFRYLVSEIIGGEFGRFPQLAECPLVSRLRLKVERARFAGKVVLATNVVCEFDRWIKRHGKFVRLRPWFLMLHRRGSPLLCLYYWAPFGLRESVYGLFIYWNRRHRKPACVLGGSGAPSRLHIAGIRSDRLL